VDTCSIGAKGTITTSISEYNSAKIQNSAQSLKTC
jgi:hypothetical protein